MLRVVRACVCVCVVCGRGGVVRGVCVLCYAVLCCVVLVVVCGETRATI